jgi:NAD(P)-dependent dehydrogenase (short-subunit alcohol dehydrogenase family)
MSNVRGKVVAVTGGARGIGLATAEALRAAGATVAVGDLEAKDGVRRLDVTDRASFTAFLDQVEEQEGPLDVLVNNAGIMPIGPLTGESDDDARRCLDINVHGVMLGTKLALGRMEPRGRGHIVNIASLAGVIPTPGMALYNASKAAVVAFTEAARLEYKGRGIDLSAVLPSFTNTELVAGTRSPKGQRNCEPSDIAEAVLKLIAKPRPRAIVPPKFAPSVALGGLFPARLREASLKRYGLDTIFLDFDASARKAYDERIRH